MNIPLLSKRVIVLLLIVLMTSSLCSCAGNRVTSENSKELLDSLRAKIYEVPEVTVDTVYWTKNGTVFHLYKDCTFLARSENIRYGPVAESGRKKLCDACEKRFNELSKLTDTDTAEEPNDTTPLDTLSVLTPLETENVPPAERSLTEDTTGQTENNTQTVYWTPSGSVWHTDPNCTSLARSSDVRSGTIEESGKSRACKKCSGQD